MLAIVAFLFLINVVLLSVLQEQKNNTLTLNNLDVID